MAKGWIKRLKTEVKMILKGPKYYASTGGKHAKYIEPIKPIRMKPRKPKKLRKRKKLVTTTRTKAIRKGLRAGGLTEKEIARFKR